MSLASARLGWITFWLMTAGLVLAAIPLVGNAATVMFTFYPPLTASPWFYIGLVLVVIASWVWCVLMLVAMQAWKRENHNSRPQARPHSWHTRRSSARLCVRQCHSRLHSIPVSVSSVTNSSSLPPGCITRASSRASTWLKRAR